MEGPNSNEQAKLDYERVLQLKERIDEVMARYKLGEAGYEEALPYLNEIQQIHYRALQRKYPEKYAADYDSVAQVKLGSKSELYTKLLDEHPVVAQIEQVDFAFWRKAIALNYPEVILPETGTASDVFKAALRQIISEYGEKIDAETITKVELFYILKDQLNPEDFYEAQVLIEEGIN